MKRINFLAVLLGLAFGLSGCVVYDDEPVYVHHPYDSYESAVDYYHRPPRPYISQHHKYQTVHPKKKHIDEHHHVKKPEPVKRHIDEHHHAKKPEPIKKDDHFKKSQPPVNDKIHDKKMPEHHDIKKDMGNKPVVNQPKQPAKDIIRDKKTMEHHNVKNVNVQSMKPKHMGRHK